MAQSMRGGFDLNAALENDTPLADPNAHHQKASNDDAAEKSDSTQRKATDAMDDDDDNGCEDDEEYEDSEDDIFTSPPPPVTSSSPAPTGSNAHTPQPPDCDTPTLFIPTSCIVPDDNDAPIAPNHSAAELPVGSDVWIWHPEDVFMLAPQWWTDFGGLHCGGAVKGTIVRHCQNSTLVSFKANAAASSAHAADGFPVTVAHSLTFPRACLAKAPPAKKIRTAPFDPTKTNLPYGSIMQARATTKRVKPTDATYLELQTKPTTLDQEVARLFPFTTGAQGWQSLMEGRLADAKTHADGLKRDDAEGFRIKLLTAVLQSNAGEAAQLCKAMAAADTSSRRTGSDAAADFLFLWRAHLATANLAAATDALNRASLCGPKSPSSNSQQQQQDKTKANGANNGGGASSPSSSSVHAAAEDTGAALKKLLERLSAVNNAFSLFEKYLLDRPSHRLLRMSVDHQMLRIFSLKQRVAAGDVIAHDTVLVGIPDCTCAVLCCTSCHRMLRPEGAVLCPHGTGFHFCNSECASNAWWRFLETEATPPLRRAFRSMSGAIRVAESIVGDELRNAAFLTIRVVSTALSTVKNATEVFPITFLEALTSLGIYPFPENIGLQDKLKQQLDMLHASIAAVLAGTEEGALLTGQMFADIFRSCWAYGRVVRTNYAYQHSPVAALLPKRPLSASGAGIGGARPHSRSESKTASQPGQPATTTGVSATASQGSRSVRDSLSNSRVSNSPDSARESPSVQGVSAGPSSPTERQRGMLFVITRLTSGNVSRAAAPNATLTITDEGKVELTALQNIEEGEAVHHW